jgi:hypothetical protein
MIGNMGSLGPPAGRMLRTLLDMSTTLGPVAATALVVASVVGTPAACWFGSVALVDASGMPFTARAGAFCASCTILGVAAEMLKLGLAPRLGLQGGYRCQTVFLLFWVLCVAYAWLIPILLLAHALIWPTGGGVFVVCAIAWAFVQVMSGLAPAVNWSASTRQTRVDPPCASVDNPAPEPPPSPEEGAATELGRARVDDDGLFEVLRKLAGQPGSRMGGRVRISQDREIIGWQRNLALVLGMSKATLHRRVHRLDKQGRLSVDNYDDVTRISLP